MKQQSSVYSNLLSRRKFCFSNPNPVAIPIPRTQPNTRDSLIFFHINQRRYIVARDTGVHEPPRCIDSYRLLSDSQIRWPEPSIVLSWWFLRKHNQEKKTKPLKQRRTTVLCFFPSIIMAWSCDWWRLRRSQWRMMIRGGHTVCRDKLARRRICEIQWSRWPRAPTQSSAAAAV